ncbi:MAG: GcrA family cell cycle regulator [Alphaproteobacteria bacterium]|nr:GcrA family cell cycle regulator [Alphaproteobacteria bacterium]
MSKGWDNTMLKKLKALVGKGFSTSEMGKKLGMSKNAVVGKLNRMGWNAKATEPQKVKAKPAPKKVADKKTTKTVKKEIAKKVVVSAKSKSKTTVKPILKKTTKKVADKKVTKTTKTVKKEVVKKTKSVAKPIKTTAKPKKKEVKKIEVKKPIKTASKKTNKDLALYEHMIQHALQMANLKPNQCRWPIGDPDSDNFHFCGETVFTGKPYCYEHCKQAYQFTAPKKK